MTTDSPDDRDALTLAEEAEAEAEAALAEARAKAARARAEHLRRQVQAHTEATPAPESDPGHVDTPPAGRRSARRLIAAGAAVVVLCALLGLSGFMAWKGHGAEQLRQREAEAAAVARQGVVNIMSLDFTNAQGDVQRVLDSATGRFRDDFRSESEFLIKALEESKVVTEVTVNGVAVESVSADAAVVLVAAQSKASNATDPRQDPQQFRVAVTLARDSGALKMSQVDFL
jgi:Mce-associated membrane protein